MHCRNHKCVYHIKPGVQLAVSGENSSDIRYSSDGSTCCNVYNGITYGEGNKGSKGSRSSRENNAGESTRKAAAKTAAQAAGCGFGRCICNTETV